VNCSALLPAEVTADRHSRRGRQLLVELSIRRASRNTSSDPNASKSNAAQCNQYRENWLLMVYIDGSGSLSISTLIDKNSRIGVPRFDVPEHASGPVTAMAPCCAIPVCDS
jgi:hypothetical protein